MINLASNLFVSNSTPNCIYKIYIGRGNNSKMIQAIFKLRWWWVEVEDEDDKKEANFVWTQNR